MELNEPADGQWGMQMENGSWTGVVLSSYHLTYYLTYLTYLTHHFIIPPRI